MDPALVVDLEARGLLHLGAETEQERTGAGDQVLLGSVAEQFVVGPAETVGRVVVAFDCSLGLEGLQQAGIGVRHAGGTDEPQTGLAHGGLARIEQRHDPIAIVAVHLLCQELSGELAEDRPVGQRQESDQPALRRRRRRRCR